MFIKNIRFLQIFVAAGFLAAGLVSCWHSNENLNLNVYEINDFEAPEAGSPLEPVNFGYAATVTINIPKTRARNVVFVKMNRGNEPVSYEASGKIIETSGGSFRNAAAGPLKLIDTAEARGAAHSALAAADEEHGYVHYTPAWEFNNNPPRGTPQRTAAPANRSVIERQIYSVGDTKNFWIDNISGAFESKTGKLLYSSIHADVWALKEKETDNSFYISETDASEIAQKFDAIYSYETALLGYEYGGGPGGTGGVDGNPRVQILVYDIPQAGVAGYFWGKDAFADGNTAIGNLRSNQAEIFYIDSVFYTNPESRNSIYSTLVHEFQHMIQFNLKTLTRGITASTWYNEMLSMLAEDVISPLINIRISDKGHPAKDRFPAFLTHYWVSGVTEHNASNINVLYHYANNYGFGAYLIRSFGGAPLLRAMLQNDTIDEKSILNAITAVNGEEFSGIQFDTLQKKLSIAMFNQSQEGYSFRRPQTYEEGGTIYTCYPLSILSPDEKYIGTYIFLINTFFLSLIPARGFVCESDNSWLNINEDSQDISIKIERPANPNVKLYLLMLR